MLTEHDIDAILRDCYEADPSLREREKELRPLVRLLVESRPDTRFDKDVARLLRDKLTAQSQKKTVNKGLTHFLDTMQKKYTALLLSGGAVAVSVIAIVLLSPKTPTVVSQPFHAAGTPSQVASVTTIADNAFGSLSAASTTGGAPTAAPMAAGSAIGTNQRGAPSLAPMQGTTSTQSAPHATPPAPMPNVSGGSGSAGSGSVSSGDVGGGIASKVMIMPIMPQANLRYVFKGQLPNLSDKIDVYRHVQGFAAGVGVQAFAPLINEVMDANKFGSGQLQSLNFAEDRPDGYVVYVDAVGGSVSLNQNWQKWPRPENGNNTLTADAFPADDAVIAVADSFLSDYGISKASLGTPTVSNEWRVQNYAVPEMMAPGMATQGATATRMPMYVPDVVGVIYPQLVDGKQVVDESGAPTGVTVNVNVGEMKVDSLNGLLTDRYEKSSYAGETDPAALKAAIERGGLYQGWMNPDVKTVDVEVGAPELVFTQYWQNADDGTSQQLYIPALRFPVLNLPKDQPYARTAVVVPLAKDILEKANEPQPTPVPMPLNGGPGIMKPMVR